VGVDPAVNGGGLGPGAGSRTVQATVEEERPAAVYVVVLENQHRVLAHLVGAVRRNFVRLVPGDRVEVEIAPHDPTRGRIIGKVSVAGPRPLAPGSEVL
jgi:translation initiation factor IF-1